MIDLSEMRKQLIESTLELGIHRIHEWPCGRRIQVQKRGECYVIVVTYKRGGWKWEDGCGYRDINECVHVAEQLFDIDEWNRFDGESWKGKL